LTTFTSEKVRHAQLEKAFAAAGRAHTLAKEQYKEGVLDLLSVLDAQATMLEVQGELSDSKQTLATSFVGIYKSLGGSWQVLELSTNLELSFKSNTSAPGLDEKSS
jgi:outer membrane protein TolC